MYTYYRGMVVGWASRQLLRTSSFDNAGQSLFRTCHSSLANMAKITSASLPIRLSMYIPMSFKATLLKCNGKPFWAWALKGSKWLALLSEGKVCPVLLWCPNVNANGLCPMSSKTYISFLAKATIATNPLHNRSSRVVLRSAKWRLVW